MTVCVGDQVLVWRNEVASSRTFAATIYSEQVFASAGELEAFVYDVKATVAVRTDKMIVVGNYGLCHLKLP